MKKTEKNRTRINSNVKPFWPDFSKRAKNRFSQRKHEDEYWQPNQDFPSDLNFGNLLESGCFQLLNEKLQAFASGRFQRPQQLPRDYNNNHFMDITMTKSKTGPSGAAFSENGDDRLQNRFYTSESSDADFYETHHGEARYYDRLDNEIYRFVESIEKKISSVSAERNIIESKILEICQSAFKEQSVTLDKFGSLTTGLALESSDLDLVVTGLKIEDRDDVVEHIRILTTYFNQSEYFRKVNAIEGASFPIIKLEADLQKIRDEESKDEATIDPTMRFLHIDITFEDHKRIKSDLFWEGVDWDSTKIHHLGIKSVHLVKSYLKDYTHLKEITLVVKKLLCLKGLNSPYKGGLSSYGIVIMIVAYMNFFSIQNAYLNISQLLIHFLEFYGSKFDERNVGILVSRGGCYYPFNSVSDDPIVIKDPLNIENNIGKSSYRISEIKALFTHIAGILDYQRQNFHQVSEEDLQEQDQALETED
mmetsp:Transcript_17072/g.16766  ORF Transcript_17072/g.16766 Transcript_17072/m.16766 type:complete len:477 (-) Transcript_17072:43-1473(-)